MIARPKLNWRVVSCLLTCLTTLLGAGAFAAPTTQPGGGGGAFAKPDIDLSKDKTLFVVGYAHLDTQWRWAYPQVIREFIPNTLKNNFALFPKYPHYVFNFSGSRRYQMMKEYYPDDYAKLKEYVAAGRWFPCGSSVDENDANVPSAESIVRHVLYGNRYFRHEFGVASDEFMLPDCFGFPAALPSILAHCGIRGFSTQKLTWGSAVGIPFKVGVWEGPDGQSVIAALDPGAYTGKVTENLAKSESWTKRVEDNGKASGVYTDYHYFGTGDRGGAPIEESVKWVETSATTKDGPMQVVVGPADWMFKCITDEQRAKLPKYKGELLLTEHSSGSITSEAYMKRWNRKNELLADDAERASVGAMWLGALSYPGKRLEDAWTLVLGSQMHDMLPGTSLPKAYEFCWNDEILAGNQFAAVTDDAVSAIAGAMDTRGSSPDDISLVVYNPLSIDRSDMVEATVRFPGKAPADVRVLDAQGKPVPSQILEKSDDGQTLKLAFVATAPSVGFATYNLQAAAEAAVMPANAELKATGTSIENARYKLTLDKNGDVNSIFDKKASKEILAAPLRLAFQYENPARYPAWNMDWNDRKNPPRAYVVGPAEVNVRECGPVRASLEVKRRSEGSTFIQRIQLGAGDAADRIDFDTQIDWQTKQSSLKAVIPLASANPKATYQIQVGTLERGNNDPKKFEVPQHQWFDLTDPKGSYGVSVLNDSKFGSDKPDDQTIRLTLLYTPGVRGGTPDQATQDLGRHHIVYSLYPHEGDWRAAKTQWQAARLNQPPLVFQSPAHEGALGKSMSLLKTSTDQVTVQAIKKAEDGDEIIVRLKELTGQDAKGVKLQFASPIVSARQVDGQERPLGEAKVEDGQLVTDLGAYRMAAFALKIAPAANKAQPVKSQSIELAYDSDVVSSNANTSDGAFDSNGRTIPAEQLPHVISNGGVEFQMGPTQDGKKNAIACHGQTISLPAGDFDRVHLLAASNDGDVRADFDLDGKKSSLVIQNWTGYIGQWDNRQWEGNMPESGSPTNAMIGLVPAFVKPAQIAWFCSHLHAPNSGDQFYQYSYLYHYALPLSAGAKTLTLPDNDHIRILAIAVTKNDANVLQPAAPLFDTLQDHTPDAPVIEGPTAAAKDSVPIKIEHPLYWHQGELHYTLDGSEPTEKSPTYSGPVMLASSATVKARAYLPDGRGGPIGEAKFDVDDTTPPTVAGAMGFADTKQLRVKFSEPLDKSSAETADNYRLEPGDKVSSASLGEDGKTVTLALAAPLPSSTTEKLTITGVKDRSPAGNAISGGTATEVKLLTPVFSRERIPNTPRPGEAIEKVAGLPTGAHDAWTINLMVRMPKQPANQTLIAGFGGAATENEGHGRYLAKFANGIHFWGDRRDVESSTPLELNRWQMLTATYDGHVLTLYQDAKQISQAPLELNDDPDASIRIAPVDPWDKQRSFQGQMKNLTIWNAALSPEALETIWEANRPKGQQGPETSQTSQPSQASR